MRYPLLRAAYAAAQVVRANVTRLPHPLKVNLCVTYWCQYRCKTCNIWQRKPADELTTDELLQFIRQAPPISWLDVTGGEVFLREDIGEILLAVLREWKSLALLHFPTNGFLTDRIVKTVAALEGKGKARLIVTVSLDGDEALNDTIRGIRGGYRRQIETFKALRAMKGVEAVLGMTLSRLNVDRVDETFRACQCDCPDLTIDEFHVNVAQLSDHYYGNTALRETLAEPAALRHALRAYQARRGRPRSLRSLRSLRNLSAAVETSYLQHLDTFLDVQTTPMRCHALRSSCFVDPWGTVFPCISYARPIGRLRETGMDLAAIWRAAETRHVQQEIWDGDCPQCWTACEAYQSILGNALRVWDPPVPPGRAR